MSEGIQPEVVLNEFGELSRKSRRELIAHGIDPDTAVIEHIRTQSNPIVGSAPVPPAAPVIPAAQVVAAAPFVPALPVIPAVRAIPASMETPPAPPAPTPPSFADLLHGNAASVAVPVPAPVAPVAPVAQAAPTAPPAAAPFPLAPLPSEPSVFAPSLSRRDMRNLRERSDNTAEIPVIFDRPDDETYDDLVDVLDGETSATPRSVSEMVVESVVVIEDDSVSSGQAQPQTISEATAAIAISESIASRRRAARNFEQGVDRREDSAEVQAGYGQFSISTTSTHSTGVIPTTGSALILPTLPEHAPGALSSFTHTGEIFLTGSIILPSSIGQYGADVLSLDTSEIDVIADDDEISASQDLAPVRASSAVSAYSTSNTVVTVPSKLRDRLPLALAITAAGLAVVVVALFITGYVLGVF